MYCSSCGLAVKPELSYCNRCGVELNAKARSAVKLTTVPPAFLVAAIVFVTVFGLGALTGLMAVMRLSLNFDTGLITGFAGLAFLLICAVDSVFIWLLLRAMSMAKAADPLTQQRPTNRELDSAPARALAEPAASVTEHTTRTLEPSHSERGAE